MTRGLLIVLLAASLAAAADTSAPETPKPLPQRVDWRMHGVIGPVISDLDGCAVAAPANAVATAVGAQRSIASKEPFVAVSTQETIDCVFGTCDWGRAEGSARRIYEWYAAHRGGNVSSAAWLPYLYSNTARPCNLTGAPTASRISGWRRVTRLDEEAMARVVAERGPVVVELNALPLEMYLGGVWNASNCTSPFRRPAAALQHGGPAGRAGFAALKKKAQSRDSGEATATQRQQVDYVASVVGYDLTAPVPYWIVRFTFGEDYGMGGYVYLQYGHNTCLVAQGVTYPIVAL